MSYPGIISANSADDGFSPQGSLGIAEYDNGSGGTNLFRFINDENAGGFHAHISTDQGQTWALADDGNSPAQTAAASFASVQVGATVTIFALSVTTGTLGSVLNVHTFDASTKKWGSSTTATDTFSAMNGPAMVSAAYDGAIIQVYFNGAQETISTLDYERVYRGQWDGGWTAGAVLLGQAGVAEHFWAGPASGSRVFIVHRDPLAATPSPLVGPDIANKLSYCDVGGSLQFLADYIRSQTPTQSFLLTMALSRCVVKSGVVSILADRCLPDATAGLKTQLTCYPGGGIVTDAGGSAGWLSFATAHFIELAFSPKVNRYFGFFGIVDEGSNIPGAVLYMSSPDLVNWDSPGVLLVRGGYFLQQVFATTLASGNIGVSVESIALFATGGGEVNLMQFNLVDPTAGRPPRCLYSAANH